VKLEKIVPNEINPLEFYPGEVTLSIFSTMLARNEPFGDIGYEIFSRTWLTLSSWRRGAKPWRGVIVRD
jgi:hypothetical protein